MPQRSVLADAPFEQHKLTYTLPGSGPGGEDEWGNPLPPVDVTGELTATVAVDRARQLQVQPGADVTVIPVLVELVQPIRVPIGIGQGSLLTLVWGGWNCTFKVMSVSPNDLPIVAFGDVLRGDITQVSPAPGG